MSESTASPPSAAPLPAGLLEAWLGQSHDLLALTDASGRLRWCNPLFERATGLAPSGDLRSLAPAGWHDGDPLLVLTAALQSGRIIGDTELALRAISGATLWVGVRVTPLGHDRLWTLCDTTQSHELATRMQHQSELLDMAQEFGRLGVWERQIPSGTGRWDRHVFGFWGLDPAGGTPDHAEASSKIHPDDRSTAFADSTHRAGHYANRYRVIRPDSSVRWIHSQWEVKNSSRGRPDRAIGIMVDDTEVYELARSLDSTTAHLKLAVDLGNIIIWRHDLKTGRLHYNERGYAILGIPVRPEGLSLEETRAMVHPEDIPKLAASAQSALATGLPSDVEARYRRSDGTWRYLLARRVVERSGTGEPIAFIGVTLDVTDQVEHSRRAEQLARRMEAAAEAARVGIWATTFGTEETEWDAQTFKLFDRTDTTRPPTWSEWLNECVHPDDAERVAQSVHHYMDGERGALEIEFRIRHRDGRTRWMVLRADVDRSGPDRNRVFGIAMDVTERHEALTALHAASERAALIARHAGIGTWETDDQGLPAMWDEQMFRLRGIEPRATALNRDERLALLHPDDRSLVIDAAPDFGADVRTAAYEFRIRMPDGSYRWLASRSAVMLDEQGKVVRRVGVNWDITEAKNAEIARQQALLAERESQAKSQFLSRMSHELRTPLNAVLGFTQLLQLEARQAPASAAESARAARLEHIRAAGEHLLTLIDDALDLSSLQSGTLRLDPQPVALDTAVAHALPLVAELAAAHGVTVRTARLDGVVRADPTRLQQVLLNLLTNAIKYNRPGGHVLIDARTDAGHVQLNVHDTGRGMTAEQLDHLFEPFNRLGVESEGIEGSGIGLTIVKALVEGMAGQISVSSRPGQGTVFRVTLPLQARFDVGPAAPASHDEHDLPMPALQRERSGQLLYIEDNSVNVLLVEELVRSLSGLRITSETTGAAGVARALSLRPDLILVDMQLPDFDGFEVLRRLREHPDTASIPCIALSANAMPDDIDRGMASGFDDYWTKPIKFKPFLAALDRLFPAEHSA